MPTSASPNQRLSLQSQLTSTTPRDKPPRMLDVSLVWRSSESSMSPLQLHLPSEWIRRMLKLSLFTIWEVVPSISQFWKSTTECSRLRLQTETPVAEEKMLMESSSLSSPMSSRHKLEWISERIRWPSRELERLPKRLRLSCHQPPTLKSTFPIWQLMLQALSIWIWTLLVPSWSH